MEQLNSDLQRALVDLRQAKRLRGQLAQIEQRLRDRTQRLAKLREELDRERADVRKLEGVSLASIYYSIISNKEERLKEERAEAFRAKLAHDQCRAEVRQLEEDRGRYQAALGALGDVEEAHVELLKRKEAHLRSAGGPGVATLLELTKEHAELTAELREVDEARAAGRLALESLDDLSKSLGSAREWGTWDMLGGGALVTAQKYSHVDQAREYAEEAQRDLFHFQTELKDVQINAELSVEVSDLDRFADYVLDGIFDGIVQLKINRASEETEDVQADVDALLQGLTAQQATLQQRVAEVAAERDRHIAEA